MNKPGKAEPAPDVTDSFKTSMILAAGRGERMRPLTDRVPKPLLEVIGRPLIEYHIEKLATAGIRRIVINHAYLGQQIEKALGDGTRWHVDIRYSAEREALETAGGIANALDLIDAEVFTVINSDVFSDYDYANLAARTTQLQNDTAHVAHLVLVDNPSHHLQGDFGLKNDHIRTDSADKLTFSGLAVYRREMFCSISAGERAPLAPLLQAEARAGRATGEHYAGHWADIGTPERLACLNLRLARETS